MVMICNNNLIHADYKCIVGIILIIIVIVIITIITIRHQLGLYRPVSA